MIKTVTSSSPHMYAASGGSSLPYVSSNINNPIQGMLRINNSEMQVFDGNSWITMYMGNADIGLNNDANSAISWAINKMKEEEEWKKLSESSQAVKIALDNLDEARKKVDVIAKLAREHDKETTTS